MPAKAATSNKKEALVQPTQAAATKKSTSKSPVRSKSPAPKGKKKIEETKVAPPKGN